MSEKLAACPFCGGNKLTVEDNGDFDHHRHFWIACHGCDSEGPWSASPEAATTAWSRRALASSGSAAPVAVPDGWRLVPEEATDAMCRAEPDTATCHQPTWRRAMWRAMLSASPLPEERA